MSERNSKRLDYLGYVNVGWGILSMALWALPGPWMIQVSWQILDGRQIPHDPVGASMITIMRVGVVLVVILFWLFSLVSLVNGYLILKRRRYRTCIALSGISIVGTPIGLVIGIVSLVMLSQGWAKDLFSLGRPLEPDHIDSTRSAPDL
jgi:hypothetical protein